jgi:hypothetical protein
MYRKITLILITVLVTSLTVQSQSIKDYYLPDNNFNKATFYMPDKNGNRTEMTRTIFYIKKERGYDITDAKMYNGSPTAIQTTTIVFGPNEVKMTQSIATTILETNKKRQYNPARILLKMPTQGQKTSWVFVDLSGTQNILTASWTTVEVDGVQKKAIKVTSKNAAFKAHTNDYYVSGIGLWRSEIEDQNGKIIISDKFDELSVENTN